MADTPRTFPRLTIVAPIAGRVLMKPDRPRTIDRFIDYFGDGGPDVCGERLLDETNNRELHGTGAA
jgi:hypothetical protein